MQYPENTFKTNGNREHFQKKREHSSKQMGTQLKTQQKPVYSPEVESADVVVSIIEVESVSKLNEGGFLWMRISGNVGELDWR